MTRKKAMDDAALALAKDLCKKLLDDPEWADELYGDNKSATETLISVATAVSLQLQSLRFLLTQATGMRPHWGDLHDAVESATRAPKHLTKGEPQLTLQKIAQPIVSCLIHTDLEPHVRKLRDQAPGQSDSSVALHLDRISKTS